MGRTTLRVLLVVFGLSLAGCSGGKTSATGSSASTIFKNGIITVGSAFTAIFGETVVPISAAPQATTFLEFDAGASSCTVRQATPTSSPGGVLSTDVSAGTITITGGQAPIVLMPQVHKQGDGGSSVIYLASNPGVALTAPGDALTITASGDTVPPFTIDIMVPEAITLTRPDPAMATPLPVDRSMDLPIAWTGGGSSGEVTFGITQTAGSTTTDINCSSPPSAGGGAIPASALSYLSPLMDVDAGPWGPNPLVVLPLSVKSLDVQDWKITVGASAPTGIEVNVAVE